MSTVDLPYPLDITNWLYYRKKRQKDLAAAQSKLKGLETNLQKIRLSASKPDVSLREDETNGEESSFHFLSYLLPLLIQLFINGHHHPFVRMVSHLNRVPQLLVDRCLIWQVPYPKEKRKKWMSCRDPRVVHYQERDIRVWRCHPPYLCLVHRLHHRVSGEGRGG